MKIMASLSMNVDRAHTENSGTQIHVVPVCSLITIWPLGRCATINSMGRGETMSFNCAGMQGQYVTITIPGRYEYLTVCEVQVLAHPWLYIGK